MNGLKEKCFWSSVTGFFVVCIAGTINHYLYGLSGRNPIIGMFTPVNESVWEHLKLLFFPYLAYILAEQLIYGRYIRGFLFSRAVGVICGMTVIPLLFYAYTVFTGRSLPPADIMIFVISVMLSFTISFDRIVKRKDEAHGSAFAAIILLCGIAVLFFGMTFFPPSTILFQPPVSRGRPAAGCRSRFAGTSADAPLII